MERNAGLDVARAAAIVLVLITHGSSFFLWDHYDVLAFSYVTGYFGVEIFFVLSGFLIGKILLKEIVENGSWKSLFRFYVRRWFRTLPLYFFVLLVTWLIIGRQFHWYNLLFLQNFDEKALNVFMPVSWSLTIEEWFYLVVPLFLLLFCIRYGGNKAALVIGVCSFIMLAECAARMVYVWVDNLMWDYGIRKNIPLRIDSLVTGVLLAAMQRYCRSVYERFIRSKWGLLAAVAALILCGIFVYNHIGSGTMDQSFFARTFLFSIVSIAFAVCIAGLEGSRPLNSGSFIRGRTAKIVTFLSVTSYAAYLTHWEIFIYYKSLIGNPSLLSSYSLCIFAIVIVFVVSFLLHKLLEQPCMNARERLPGFLSARGGGEAKHRATL